MLIHILSEMHGNSLATRIQDQTDDFTKLTVTTRYETNVRSMILLSYFTVISALLIEVLSDFFQVTVTSNYFKRHFIQYYKNDSMNIAFFNWNKASHNN